MKTMFFMNRPSGFQKNQKLNQDEIMVSVQRLACGHGIGLSFDALHGQNKSTLDRFTSNAFEITLIFQTNK